MAEVSENPTLQEVDWHPVWRSVFGMLITKVKMAVVVLLGAAVVLGQTTSGSVPPTETFDKPARRTVVNLGWSTYLMPNNPSRIQLSCFYYPDFMVKQLNDPGMKGVRWVTVTPVINGDALACRLTHIPTERFVAKEWWGFEGVKGPLLFLEAADGDDNAGMPFRVLDMKTGQKIFEDSAGGGVGHLKFAHPADGSISLRYLRRVGGDCSIPKDGMTCWNKFRRHYGLVLTTVPKCAGYRREGEKEWVVGDEGVPPAETKTPSVIDYPVVVELFPQPTIRAVPGPVGCFPIE
jgi:hypothetical protein